ncbi:MAG TPA: SA1362 family protein [Pseudogracilibacillus sp.]|nr:SA1362 family protein [Pseudogracilibacillus sp.]
MRSFTQYIVYFLIGLAVFGFGTYLIKNPTGLMITLMLTAIFAFIMYKVLTFFITRNQGGYTRGRESDEMKKYKRAAKESRKKYEQQFKADPKKPSSQTSKGKRRKRRHAPHLRVIDGKKDQDKNDRVL